MAYRSLRDEMARGNRARPVPPARRRKQKRFPLAATVGVIVVVLIAVIALLAQVRSPSSSALGADDSGGSSTSSADPRSTVSPEATDAAADETTKPAEDDAAEDREPTVSDQVRAELAALPLVPGQVAAPYDRDLFGQAWFDIDRNGCDTRNDILRRDLREVVLKEGTGGCKVLGGVLDDWYSGTTVTFVSGGDTSRLVQIDHVVPLSWAWQHGADAWSDEARLAFANDPINLNATTDVQNMKKSDSGPAEWLPGSDAAQCRYAQRFTAVLSAYALGIDLRNRAMITGILDECDTSDAFGAFDQAAPGSR